MSTFDASFIKKFFFALILAGMTDFAARAAQSGPVFPSHRFPTDQSYHLGYSFSALSTGANYVSGATQALPQKSGVSVLNHDIAAEFQPNRFLNLGLLLNVTQVKITNGATAAFQSKQSLGDQRLFFEYRFFDVPGRSAGLALVAKFPGYNNTSVSDLGTGPAVLLGDAQTDLTTLITTEMWLSQTVRTRLDMGFTYRTEQYASEIPFLASIAYVTPSLDFEFRILGNATLGNDGFSPANTDVNTIQTAFGSSEYAFSKNPWIVVIEPRAEIWTSPSFALNAAYAMSMRGNNSPQFTRFLVGMTYRWAETKIREKRTYQEVHIETDQESGTFQGEKNEKPERRAPNPERIEAEPSRGDDSSDEP